jgi:hypothetical protein
MSFYLLSATYSVIVKFKRQTYADAGKFEGWRPQVVARLLAWRQPTHPQLVYCMQHARTGLHMSYQMTMKRVCVSRGPQAVICKNKVQASSAGGSMKWDYCS